MRAETMEEAGGGSLCGRGLLLLMLNNVLRGLGVQWDVRSDWEVGRLLIRRLGCECDGRGDSGRLVLAEQVATDGWRWRLSY